MENGETKVLHFDSMTLEESSALGRAVSLELEADRTVLVGRNAAGKSALVEAIANVLRNPFFLATTKRNLLSLVRS